MLVIGFLSNLSPAVSEDRLRAFHEGLREAGYVEGDNVAILYRWGEAHTDRLPALAADLVHREVAVIVAQNNTAALAAQGATSTVPIVCTVGGDPIQMGLVASFNRPGGNITGVVIQTAELMGKRLEFLHELLPTATVVAVLVNPTNPSAMASETSNLQDAARALGLELRILQASTPNEIEAAFETLVGYRAAGLVVSADTFFTNRRSQITALAADHAVPAIYVVRFFPAAGGLMSYAPKLVESFRHLGAYTGRILKGEKPSDLPVVQPTKFELVINTQTAWLIGVEVPPSLLAIADEVIE